MNEFNLKVQYKAIKKNCMGCKGKAIKLTMKAIDRHYNGISVDDSLYKRYSSLKKYIFNLNVIFPSVGIGMITGIATGFAVSFFSDFLKGFRFIPYIILIPYTVLVVIGYVICILISKLFINTTLQSVLYPYELSVIKKKIESYSTGRKKKGIWYRVRVHKK